MSKQPRARRVQAVSPIHRGSVAIYPIRAWWIPTLIIGLGIVAAVIFLLATPFGVALANTDPVSYIKAGQSVTWGEGFRGFDGAPLVRWPPLYPALTAVPVLLGVDGIHALRLVNALALGLAVSGSAVLFLATLRSKALALLGATAVLTNWSLFLAGYMGFAEVVFTVFVVGFLRALTIFLRDRTRRALVSLAVIAALACLTRYIGITLIATGALSILLLMQHTPPAARLRCAVAFGLMASAPLLLWFGRNLVLVGTLTGGNWSNVLAEMHHAPDILASWLWTDANLRITADPTVGALLINGAVIVLALAALLVTCTVYFGKITPGALAQTPIAPTAIFAPVFTLLFTVLANTVMIAVNDRILSPLVVGVVLLLFALIDSAALWIDRRLKRPVAGIAAAVLAALWLFAPASKIVNEVRLLSHDDSAMAYNNLRWQSSPTITWLNTHALKGRLYSNAAFSVAALTPHYSALLPRTLDRWASIRLAITENYLVWFADVEAYGCASGSPTCYMPDYTLNDLRAEFQLEPMIEVDDGGVYRLSRREPPV